MLEWLFGVRGEIGRARYLAGLSLLFFSALALAVIMILAGIGLRWPRETGTGLAAFAILVLGAWSILALSARRLRDLGAPPVLVLGALAVLILVEAMFPPLSLAGPWGAVQRPLFALILAAVALALIVWPGQAPERVTQDGPGGDASKILIPIAAFAAALIGLGLVFDPLQASSCPTYRAGAPSDDCASQGLIGRYYSSILVVQANKRLDRRDPQDALKLIDSALAVRPGFVYAFNSRGLAYDQLRDGTRALQAYDQALALQPQYVHGLINRAVLLDRLGHRERALADLRTILSVQPDNAVAKDGIAYMTGARR